MHFTLENRDNIAVFSLLNENIGDNISSQLKAKILIVAQPDIDALIVDLSRVASIDSSGLGALLLAHRQLQENAIPVILVGVQSFVRSLMNMTRIEELFEFYDTVQEALEALEETEAGDD
ncbi:MAG: STAS domain-containing protein [Chloroflexota bacterium]